MHIYINTASLWDDTLFMLNVEATYTIETVKGVIASTCNMPSSMQCLFFMGQQLSNEYTLSDYHIKHTSTLELFYEDVEDCCKFFQIIAKMPDHKTITIEMEATSTIKTMKAVIKSKTNIPTDQQRIIFAGNQLDDFSTLMDCNITDGNEVKVVLRIHGAGKRAREERLDMTQKLARIQHEVRLAQEAVPPINHHLVEFSRTVEATLTSVLSDNSGRFIENNIAHMDVKILGSLKEMLTTTRLQQQLVAKLSFFFLAEIRQINEMEILLGALKSTLENAFHYQMVFGLWKEVGEYDFKRLRDMVDRQVIVMETIQKMRNDSPSMAL